MLRRSLKVISLSFFDFLQPHPQTPATRKQPLGNTRAEPRHQTMQPAVPPAIVRGVKCGGQNQQQTTRRRTAGDDQRLLVRRVVGVYDNCGREGKGRRRRSTRAPPLQAFACRVDRVLTARRGPGTTGSGNEWLMMNNGRDKQGDDK